MNVYYFNTKQEQLVELRASLEIAIKSAVDQMSDEQLRTMVLGPLQEFAPDHKLLAA